MLKIRPLREIKRALADLRMQLKHPQLKTAFRCQTHLTIEERIKLYQLALFKENIAEIGAYLGASACCFGAAMVSVQTKRRNNIFCIDTWQNDAMTEGDRDTWSEFRRNTFPYKEFIVPVRGFSTEVIDQLADHVCNLDLIFIDGDHSYDGVKADWEAYKNFLRVGSTVVFHDIGWADGVRRVVVEDVEPIVETKGQLPNLWWGVLGRKP